MNVKDKLYKRYDVQNVLENIIEENLSDLFKGNISFNLPSLVCRDNLMEVGIYDLFNDLVFEIYMDYDLQVIKVAEKVEGLTKKEVSTIVEIAKGSIIEYFKLRKKMLRNLQDKLDNN